MCSLHLSNLGSIRMPVGAAYLRSQIMSSSRQSSTRAYFAFRANAKLPLMDVKPHLVISQKMPIIADEWQDHIIKLNNIKYQIKTAKTLAFRGCHVVSLCFKPRIISKNKKETFKPKIKQITQQLKCCLCLQNQQIFMPLGHDRQPTVSRSLLVRFSLTSR